MTRLHVNGGAAREVDESVRTRQPLPAVAPAANVRASDFLPHSLPRSRPKLSFSHTPSSSNSPLQIAKFFPAFQPRIHHILSFLWLANYWIHIRSRLHHQLISRQLHTVTRLPPCETTWPLLLITRS